jgi:hypothetical protein
MVFGAVVVVHIDEALFVEGRVDPHLLRPVGRLGGALYTDASGDIFKLPRPTWEQVRTGEVERPGT